MISHECLLAMLDYDQASGVFIWKVKPSQNTKAGAIAGSIGCNGYWRINVKGKGYSAHRLAWFYMTGIWPKYYVEHKDRNPLNNAWRNLRLATNSQNQANTAPRPSNTSGLKGVTWNKSSKRWQASIKVKGKSYYLGVFASKEDAHTAYTMAAKFHFGEYARAA